MFVSSRLVIFSLYNPQRHEMQESYHEKLSYLLNNHEYQQAFDMCHDSEKPFVSRLLADVLLIDHPKEAAIKYVESDYQFELIAMKYLEKIGIDDDDGNLDLDMNRLDVGNGKASKESAQGKRKQSPEERRMQQQEYKQGLLLFLEKISKYLKRQDLIIIIDAWILELLLCELDIITSSDQDSQKLGPVQDIQQLLNKQTLPFNLVASMTKNHLQIDILLYYCKVLEKYSEMINIHLQRNGYQAALFVLGSQVLILINENDPNLYYKYSGILVEKIPTDLVKLWFKCKFLDPRLLIPSILKVKNLELVVEYLEMHIYQMENKDKAVHNLLFKLYCDLQLQDFRIVGVSTREFGTCRFAVLFKITKFK